jgi:hypothetical protein
MSRFEADIPNYKRAGKIQTVLFVVDILLIIVLFASNIMYPIWWETVFPSDKFSTEHNRLLSYVVVAIVATVPIVLFLIYYYIIAMMNFSNSLVLPDRQKGVRLICIIGIDKSTLGDFCCVVSVRTILIAVIGSVLISHGFGMAMATGSPILWAVCSSVAFGIASIVVAGTFRAANKKKIRLYNTLGGQ